jgi:hypothetical protein
MVLNIPVIANIYLKSGSQSDILLSKLKIKDYGTYNIEFWIYVNSLPTDLAFSFDDNNYYGHYNITNNSKGCIFQTSSKNLSLDLYSNNVLTFYNGRNIPSVRTQEIALIALNQAKEEVIIASEALNGNEQTIQYANNPNSGFSEGEKLNLIVAKEQSQTILAQAQTILSQAQVTYNSVINIPNIPGQAKPSAFTNHFNVQKWTYVVVSVQNNSLVELFINGKLVQSSNYNGSESINKIQKPLSTESLQFGKQLDAYITKLRINPNAITTTTVWNNYLNGNASISKINASLNLTQDGKNSNEIQLL